MPKIGDLVLDCWAWGSALNALYIIIDLDYKPYASVTIYKLVRVKDPAFSLFLTEETVVRMRNEFLKRLPIDEPDIK